MMKMKKFPEVLSIDDSVGLDCAVNIIHQGGLIAFPTDTVYGLAANPFNPAAILNIYLTKNRPPEKSIPVLIGELDHIYFFTPTLSEKVRVLIDTYWPGPLSLILPKKKEIPSELSSGPTIAIRMPNHPFALKLLQKTGPLAVTSANISGAKNPTNVNEVIEQLGAKVNLIFDGGETKDDIPSTIIDCTIDQLLLIRQGAINFSEILKVWDKK